MGQHNFEQNRRIYASLIANTIKLAKGTGLPFFFIDERIQRGDSFGARITHAAESVFAKGFDQVVLIGNDSPELNHKQLTRAVELLNEGKSVIGPAFDGGAYLLGLHKATFDTRAFEALPWQSIGLQAELAEFFKEHHSAACYLTKLGDVDYKAQLWSFIHAPAGSLLRQQLARIVSADATGEKYRSTHVLPEDVFLLGVGLRAPPVVL